MKNRKTLKQLILGSLLLLSTNSLFAQTQKVHTLQAKNSSTSTAMNSDALIQMDSNNKGLLLPRIALTGANQVAPLTAHTAGMVVYNTATVAATATIEAVTPGYYYNNGTKWVKIANTDTADITNDAWVNNTTTNAVELATKADGTTRTAGSEVRIDDNGTIFAGSNTFDSLGLPASSSTRSSYFYASGDYNADWQSHYNFTKYGYLDIGTYYSNGIGGEPRLELYRSRGTLASPQVVQNGDILGSIRFNGKRANPSSEKSIAVSIGAIVDNTNLTGKILPAKLTFSTANDDFTEFIERMTIRSSGNVGIGTATPQAKLDIKDNDGTSLIIRNATKAHTDASLANYIAFRDKDNIEYSYIGEGSSFRRVNFNGHYGYDVEFSTSTNGDYTGRTASLSINNATGNVAIGNAMFVASEKLEVVGNVKATSFISATTTYPDYVFEKYYKGFSKLNNEYNFKALPEVEAFIKANGHLPGYKPANEIIEAGSFNVTESHLMNVEKIEELYLHTIEQDKKLKAQQKENNELKQRVQKLEALVTKLMEAKK